ncbi:MAG TPA: hypothetical protein VGO65_12225 [Pseudolysinimonas sp.]|nr:hypothetical protein [Pseudolysinimonas sp.]
MMRIAGAVLVLLVLAGCSTSGSSGSRHELYDSVAGIAADSTLVVVGRVTLQEDDDSPQTTRVSTIEIVERFLPAGLGSDLDIRLPDKIGDTLQVRQVLEPYLERGQSYLLFLRPSELPGDAAAQFFVTGADAGVYLSQGTDFVHPEFDGDTLPTTLTAADLG